MRYGRGSCSGISALTVGQEKIVARTPMADTSSRIIEFRASTRSVMPIGTGQRPTS